MNNEGHGNDLQKIIAQGFDELKHIHGESFDPQKVNLAELERITGLSRSRLRTLKKKGFDMAGTSARSMPQKPTVLDGYTGIIDDLLSQGVSNSSVCFDRLKEVGYTGGLTTIKTYISRHRYLLPPKRHSVSPQGNRGRRYVTDPGEVFQMDWGFVDVEDATGQKWRCACFAMVCHHCGMRYLEFFPNARQENLFIGMIHGFAYMGIPKVILTDNMASVSNKRDTAGRPVFNGNYDEFQQMLGIETVLCKPRHPWTKGAVERLVRFMKDNFIQGRTFINVTDLNIQAIIWCHKENSRLQKGLGFVPAKEHATEPMLTLPDDKSLLLPYLAPERSIGMDGFVYYEGRRYGVPFSYRGKKVRVLRDKDELEILNPETYEILESHAVDWSYKPHYSPFQFEPAQPEEQPTMPVEATIAIADSQDDDWFRRYDF